MRYTRLKALVMTLLATGLFAAYVYGTASAATGPTTTLTTAPTAPDGAAGWFKTSPSITLEPDTSAVTYYSWDIASSVTTYTAPLNVPSAGAHTLHYFSIDSSGTTETENSRVFRVDGSLPRVVIKAPKHRSHIRRAIRIYVNPSDPVAPGGASGIAQTRLYAGHALIETTTSDPARFIVHTTRFKPGRRTFRIVVKDNAGNTIRRRRYYFIDNVSPKVPVAYVSPDIPVVDTHAELYFKVRDRVSRKVRVTVQIRKPGGKLLSEAVLGYVDKDVLRPVSLKMPFNEGGYVYRVIARDRAGNRRVRSVNFSVGNYWLPDNVKSHVFELTKNIGVRVEGTDGEHRAADYIEARLQSYGYTVERQSFTLPDGKTSYNIIARKQGTDVNQKFIVGAHYDSKSPSPGANDNGTGTGVLLELARLLRTKTLKPTMTFAFFGAEESFGVNRYPEHMGSQHYVSTMSAADKQNTAGMISVDMVGVGSTFHVRSMGTGTMSLVNDILGFANEGGAAISYRRDFGYSDHDQFEAAGIPAAWLEWRNDTLFHTTQDAYERIQWDAVDITGRFLSNYLIKRYTP